MKRNKIILVVIIIAIIIGAVFSTFYFLLRPSFPDGYLVKINNFAFDIDDGSIAYYRDMIVWCERKSAEIVGAMHNIYLYNVSTATKTLINKEPARITGFTIYGNKIAWSDNRAGKGDPFSTNISIYLYDIGTNNETELTSGDGAWMEMYRDIIVWVENIYNPFGPYSIYLYNISSGEKQLVTTIQLDTTKTSYTYMEEVPIPKIYENFIAWKASGENDTESIYLYNIETHEEKEIISNLSSHDYLNDVSIYGDKIVYGDETTVYMYNLTSGIILPLLNHSRANSAYANAHFSVIEIYKNNILAVETSLEVVGSDMFETTNKYWVYNISKGERVEIRAGLIIFENNVLGILNESYYYFFNKVDNPSKVALYLTNLKDLF